MRLEREERRFAKEEGVGAGKPSRGLRAQACDWELSNEVALFLPSASCRLLETHSTLVCRVTTLYPHVPYGNGTFCGREGTWMVSPCCNPTVQQLERESLDSLGDV